MEQKVTFETSLTLPVYKEMVKLYSESQWHYSFSRAFVMAAQLYILLQLAFAPFSTVALMALGLSIFLFVFPLLLARRNKDGGSGYKQLLFASDNQTPHSICTLEEDGILVCNTHTDREELHRYDSFVSMCESKNLLLLVTDIKMVVVIDKNQLEKIDRNALVSSLQKKCPKLKRKIKTGRSSRVLIKISYVLAVLTAVLAVASLFRKPDITIGTLTDDMSYAQMAQELTAVDITISSQTLDELGVHEDWDYKALNLLFWEGQGTYDEEWNWTPSVSGIYCFDTEVMNVDTIYTDFLTGLAAMAPELEIADVRESYGEVDWDSGTGTVRCSFQMNGEDHSLRAVMMQDWFDEDVLHQVGRFLDKDAAPECLWYAYDGGQGIMLYYGTTEQANLLEYLSGIRFRKAG